MFKAHQAPVVLADLPQHSALVSARGDNKGNGCVRFWHYATPESTRDSQSDARNEHAAPDERQIGLIERLESLRDAGTIGSELYFRALQLLREGPDELDAYNRDCLVLVERAFNREIEWDSLEASLDAVEGMDSRNHRRWTEAAQRVKELREKTITELLAEVNELDNVEHGREAIEKLKHVLCLDAEHAEAKKLLAKIESYYPPKTQTNSLGMTLVEIRAGRFLMGSPLAESGRGPGELIHAVRITKEFWLAAHEVTRDQFAKFVEATGYRTERDKAEESAAPQPYPQAGTRAVPQVIQRRF